MRLRRTREQWVKIVETFERSGVALDRFCGRRGIKPSTLKWWQWHLRSDSNGADVRLVPVDVVASAVAASVAISIAGAELHVDVGTDVAYVSALVTALRTRC
jgi:hypothetical protein